MKNKTQKEKMKAREKIYQILKVNDATNEASWWQIADEVVEAIDKAEKKGFTEGLKWSFDHKDKEEFKLLKAKAFGEGYIKGVEDEKIRTGRTKKRMFESGRKKGRREERVRWKKNLKQHFEQLKRSGWITNDKDMIDAINQVIE